MWLRLSINSKMVALILLDDGCIRVDNLSSVNRNSGIVESKIEKELELGQMTGPFISLLLSNTHLCTLDLARLLSGLFIISLTWMQVS